MPENIPYIILLAAGASFVQRTVGFGFGIFIMSALPFLMPSYGEAEALCTSCKKSKHLINL